MSLPATEHDDEPREDHRVLLSGASWADYQRILAIRGDRSAPRVQYLDGWIEIMSPSRKHEQLSRWIGHLLLVWAEVSRVEVSSFGSWTIGERRKRSGAEPDECFLVGEPGERERPELAIEVIWTSGGLDKLEIYRRLGVGEVWTWRRGAISVHVLVDGAYEEVSSSRLFPSLDLEHLTSFLDRSTTTAAMRDDRAALSAR